MVHALELVVSPTKLHEEAAEVAKLQEAMVSAASVYALETSVDAKLVEEAAEVWATKLHWKRWCLSKLALVDLYRARDQSNKP